MSIKDINIKNRTLLFSWHYQYKRIWSDNFKIDEKSYKTILIYHTGYVAIKKDLTIYSVNALYSIFGKVNGNFEEINGNMHLMVVSTN